MIILRTQVAPPPPPPPPPANPRLKARVVMTGADGSSWDLTHGPARMLQGGVTAFLPPELEMRWSESPLLDGSTYQGESVPAHPFTIPIRLGSTGSLEWRDLDADLWRALYGGECTFTVVSPDAVARTMPARFRGVGDQSVPRDPFAATFQDYDLNFTAPDPFWTGATEVVTFSPGTARNWLVQPGDPGAASDVMFFEAANTLGNAAVSNNGDIPAWPLWAITGPVNNFTVGVGDATITGGALTAGQTVWVDSHPAERTVGYTRGGNDTNAWLSLTAKRFVQIPAGSEVPINVSLGTPGAGSSVTVELTPKFRRPW